MKKESLKNDSAGAVMESAGNTTFSRRAAEIPAPPKKTVFNRWNQKLEKGDVVVYEGNVGKELYSKFHFKLAEPKERQSVVHILTGTTYGETTYEETNLPNEDLRKVGTMEKFDPAWLKKRPKEKRDKPSTWNRR